MIILPSFFFVDGDFIDHFDDLDQIHAVEYLVEGIVTNQVRLRNSASHSSIILKRIRFTGTATLHPR